MERGLWRPEATQGGRFPLRGWGESIEMLKQLKLHLLIDLIISCRNIVCLCNFQNLLVTTYEKNKTTRFKKKFIKIHYKHFEEISIEDRFCFLLIMINFNYF